MFINAISRAGIHWHLMLFIVKVGRLAAQPYRTADHDFTHMGLLGGTKRNDANIIMTTTHMAALCGL